MPNTSVLFCPASPFSRYIAKPKRGSGMPRPPSPSHLAGSSPPSSAASTCHRIAPTHPPSLPLAAQTWPLRSVINKTSGAHSAPVSRVTYSPNFSEAISADHGAPPTPPCPIQHQHARTQGETRWNGKAGLPPCHLPSQPDRCPHDTPRHRWADKLARPLLCSHRPLTTQRAQCACGW